MGANWWGESPLWENRIGLMRAISTTSRRQGLARDGWSAGDGVRSCLLPPLPGLSTSVIGAQIVVCCATLVLPDEVGRYAYRHGLFVLAQSGDAVEIRNDAKFVPTVW